MQLLSISRINAIAPYKVWLEKDNYTFSTDFDVRIGVNFDEDNTSLETSIAYWFNIVNLNGKPSPLDSKVMQTVWVIVEEFFRTNPNVLLYMCDTAGNQQAMRARLFHYWFESYKGHQRFIYIDAVIPDEDITNFVVLIVNRENPKSKEICEDFNSQVNMFNSKP